MVKEGFCDIIVQVMEGTGSTLPTGQEDGPQPESVANMEAQGIVFNAQTRIFVCKKEECGCEVQGNRKEFKRHLKRSAHQSLSGSGANSMWLGAKRLLEQSASNPSGDATEGQQLTKKYREGGWGVGILPPIEGLPVVSAKKCTRCEVMFEKDGSLRNHMRTVHKVPISLADMRKMEAIACQSLSRQSNVKKLFRVSVGRQDIISELGRALQSYDPRQESSAQNTVSEKERSGFVIVTNMPERLTRLGMTMEEAFNLARFFTSP